MQLIIPAFEGLAPRFAPHLIGETQASFGTNLKVGRGDLRGFRSLSPIGSLSPPGATYRRAIKFYKPGTDTSKFFASTDVNATALQSPLANDAFERVYYTEEGATGLRVVQFDDLDNRAAENQPAGIARPTVAPSVAPPAGSSEIRAYTYIYADQFGAQSAPAPPTIATGALGTWTISGFGSVPANVVSIHIYRSLTGNVSAGQYYLVGTTTGAPFNDTMAETDVPLQPPLVSFDNDPPIDNLKGIVLHSSGAFAGFDQRTVYFSEPYLPHAWPQTYAYTVGDLIVGIAPLLNSIIVLTKGVPYILSGNHPANIGIAKLPDPEPCTSFRSIVVMSNAVMFTSPNGLCSISAQGINRPTNPLLTREEFSVYSPDTIVAAAYGAYYIAFYDTSQGFAIALPPYEPISFMPLDRYAGVTGLDTDDRTGDLVIIQGDDIALFDTVRDTRFATTFRSKEWITPKPLNFGAFQVLFQQERVVEDDDAEQALIDEMQDYNDLRFVFDPDTPLDGFNAYPLNGEIILPNPIPELSGLPPIQPLGGEPIYDTIGTIGFQNLQFTFIADGKVVATRLVPDEKVHNLPEGYKATRYFIEISGSVPVHRVIVAETRRECMNA